jgi:hypothetical protein
LILSRGQNYFLNPVFDIVIENRFKSRKETEQ